jgi:ubiquinone/menaquinone biosynthesis C-methylase UbiE
VNYDALAHLYDTQPYRAKSVDPEILAFVAQCSSAVSLYILDIACGTGNQLLANRAVLPEVRWVGVDRSLGMLRQARNKAADIVWVQADGAMLSLQAQRFDFITCQYAFHHVQDKRGMLKEAFRVLCPGGRFVLSNICPQEMADWLYYRYFPEARGLNLDDFWLPETVKEVMETIGFVAVTVERQHLRYQQDLREWLDTVRRRDTCSQLLTISDVAYEAGVQRLEGELAEKPGPLLQEDHLCFVSIRGEKRTDFAPHGTLQ